ncbi:hypothetical protein A3B32_01445 [Candidatus Uhrbacteria bacterium RIFCSPLOWO2_01_FULL_53_9]|uniref:Uncharacterized protein n=3 Tax=Candidatus Uhriibacteriota TaxID=1752732 RepID=A0A1F7UYN9_9BACT|nr:MAG: hypothetical protein A3C17_03890 [Candidatus Uhrbacteria bacterium RIFCSPHIGHO2_02_FULL_53_13]OGL83381.1 MAG: hypothetical protein A3B32_01445 [Candidatus Uhrbacteria bacterium RIFCSPLOWO2_01_FULL_53_9]OGL89399.1 MAG: hypothetical protein A3I45_00720 [Candidatus Uhrbacteria bacterium RIFCSPLOWO2_02_FULL_53_10]
MSPEKRHAIQVHYVKLSFWFAWFIFTLFGLFKEGFSFIVLLAMGWGIMLIYYETIKLTDTKNDTEILKKRKKAMWESSIVIAYLTFRVLIVVIPVVILLVYILGITKWSFVYLFR